MLQRGDVRSPQRAGRRRTDACCNTLSKQQRRRHAVCDCQAGPSHGGRSSQEAACQPCIARRQSQFKSPPEEGMNRGVVLGRPAPSMLSRPGSGVQYRANCRLPFMRSVHAPGQSRHSHSPWSTSVALLTTAGYFLRSIFVTQGLRRVVDRPQASELAQGNTQ